MIPKRIHYCWFGGHNLPSSAQRCINSWKKFLPDYEIKRWDESNYDVHCLDYISHAYNARKYAYVSDYARFDILYKEGGIYFDTDVEIIRPIDDIIKNGNFMGFQTGESPQVNPGLVLGSSSNTPFLYKMRDLYHHIRFINPDSLQVPETIVTYTTRELEKSGLILNDKIQHIEQFTIYPTDYFCPISTLNGKLTITSNTRTIHHFDQTWQSPMRRIGRKVILKIGGYKLKLWVKKLLYK